MPLKGIDPKTFHLLEYGYARDAIYSLVIPDKISNNGDTRRLDLYAFKFGVDEDGACIASIGRKKI